ncbi:DNA cytosine methyltransferase [Solwaraspora sp. WMMA2065]|uniref:DNA cytosine methyltransferase n=1 Tax=Solwaraspora sp. WMMA2065 TaxID=3015166 RepID=UPI00259B8C5B|nr:DNA cytosine methyltransferase [Solwaraspora sp. WMMA2065]WJK32716.1 DNA (cytosine-5-)-methyltransferase [Solwaraspora sp. WMMA2065]
MPDGDRVGAGNAGLLTVVCVVVPAADEDYSPPTRDPSVKRGAYAVRLIRGPFVQLPKHPDACDEPDAMLTYAEQARSRGERLAADLFSGAGGLSLGLEEAGYRVVLAVDHYPEAVETHRHHHAGLSVNWDLGDPERIREVADLVKRAGVELLAGGPPCQPFSKAGRSMIRHKVRNGLRDPYDERRDLWRSFLEVIRLACPPAVLMENVPDMALDKEMFILRTMVHELESLGYAVEERAVDTWRYGVPQFRQRLILVALRDGISFQWPAESPERPTVWNAIGDLPEVEGGWRPAGGADGWADYAGPRTDFQRRMRRKVAPEDEARVFDHITRPVREDDLEAFRLMDATTRYSDLPAEMKRYRDDIFDDKYKRLDMHGLSRTITAHIAKDGYWYIHPEQHRTITVREAARLQTFPDDFRFAGPPSAAFKQIGNAVPPMLGEHLANAISTSLQAATPAKVNTQQIAAGLAEWFDGEHVNGIPWLRAQTRWQVIQGEILLDRTHPDVLRQVWRMLQTWRQPQDTVTREDDLRRIGRFISREARADTVAQLARTLADDPTLLRDDDALRRVPGLYESVADLAVLVVPAGDDDNAEEPVLVTKGVLRVAARFSGTPVGSRNRLTDGRLEVARMIGIDSDARSAHLGLIDLANTLCRPQEPVCSACPLAKTCVEARTQSDPLF